MIPLIKTGIVHCANWHEALLYFLEGHNSALSCAFPSVKKKNLMNPFYRKSMGSARMCCKTDQNLFHYINYGSYKNVTNVLRD